MIHTLATLALLAAITTPAAAAQGPDDLVRAALHANATLSSLEAQATAMGHRITQAGAGPEPLLGLEYSNMPVTAPYPGVHPMSGVQLSIRQPLLAPGTLTHRRDAAAARAEVADEALRAAQVDLAAAVRRGYWNLALHRQLGALAGDQVALAEQLVAAVRAGYEVGRAEQHQLLSAQLGRDHLAEVAEDHGRVERELLAGLTAAVQQDAPLDVAIPGDLGPPPPVPRRAPLLDTALRDSPDLGGISAAVDAEQRAAEAARREAHPDLTVWAGYRLRAPIDGMDGGTNQASLGIAVPLPTAATRRWGARAAEHEARSRAATRQLDSARAGVQGELDAALARWERADDRERRHREDLVPAALATWEATLAAYQVDRAAFPTLVQAWERLLAMQRDALVAGVDARLAEVEVQRLCGVVLEEEDP